MPYCPAMRRLLVLSLLVTLVAALLPAGAAGQVFRDPSPAGKEYAVPLEQGRGTGGGDRGGSRSDRFGQGISRQGGSEARGQGGQGGEAAAQEAAQKKAAKQRAKRAAKRRAEAEKKKRERAAAAALPKAPPPGPPLSGQAEGGSSTLWIVLLVLAVLAASGGLAYLIRRRSQGEPGAEPL
ncbi:MAG: hypothetical protein M3133_00790 [Actinomycetota bacterium]|nr:hypothetical protein [Actinomycetota bacterium]